MGKNELEPWLVEFSRPITDRDKVKPMQSRFFFLPSIKNGSMMHFILPWIHHVQGFRRVLQILWFPKKCNFRFGFKQYVLLSYLKALDATDDVPVFTGRSKFPKLQGIGCKKFASTRLFNKPLIAPWLFLEQVAAICFIASINTEIIEHIRFKLTSLPLSPGEPLWPGLPASP